MTKITEEKALRYHEEGRPGKIEVIPTKPYSSQVDLSLAYSPGVAYPCLEIQKNPQDAYRYTDKGNLVGVISNGTAVLGLGNIGALAGKPVMEGKALLFKIFAGLDAFDIEVNETDPDKFVQIVRALAPTFGGINLEDIKAPECFEIERRLKEECNIPVMHDDQHGTAIISAAGLLNALELQGKKIGDVRLVVNGAGAAAISCTNLYIALGVNPENIVMCDSKGVIRADNPNLNEQKRRFATTRDIHTLAEAMRGADVFLGLSVKDVLTPEMIKSMAPRPIVFALANPDPEINYDVAMASRDDIIVATGRSDYPNQINNVLGFPYIFRGALDCQASAINEEMKIAAVHAIARLAKLPVPSVVDEAYGMNDLHFGPKYILPKALDPRLLTAVAPEVAKAAALSKVAAKPIGDYEAYREHLLKIMGKDNEMMRRITELAKRDPQRVVFSDADDNDNMLRAAFDLAQDGVCVPILLGNSKAIHDHASRLSIDLADMIVLDPAATANRERRERYAGRFADIMCRRGVSRADALHRIYAHKLFGIMMVESGDADAFIAASHSAGHDSMRLARDIVGLKDGFSHFASMHIMNTRKGSFFMADTSVNSVSDTDTLVDTVRLAVDEVKFFARKPVAALLSYSNFGSSLRDTAPKEGSRAVAKLHSLYPDVCVDGEMQAMYALDNELRDKTFPFNKLKGKRVNTLIFPDLNSANITYQMLLQMGVGQLIGPIQIGLRKPINFVNRNATSRDIANVATIAALTAALRQKRID